MSARVGVAVPTFLLSVISYFRAMIQGPKGAGGLGPDKLGDPCSWGGSGVEIGRRAAFKAERTNRIACFYAF